MRVEKILLRGIGPFDDVTIEFPPGTDNELADVYLLTGENGTGKSTVLYALAAMIAGGAKLLGDELLSPRFRSPAGIAAAQLAKTTCAVTLSRGVEGVFATVHSPFDGRELPPTGSASSLEYYNIPPYYRGAAIPTKTLHADPRLSFDWAAFAYAGARTLGESRVTAINESRRNPLENSLSFTYKTDSQALAEWLTHQFYRRLKAQVTGDTLRADQLDESLRRVERCIGEIINDEQFNFDFSGDDNEVRISWHGAITTLELLPDGLKAIVSWVADLLMRLDRIPWQSNTPVLQRSFLLLLDEIDIHLHPAWQRKVLPTVQRLFPNAQIIATTHSPFVVASAQDAKIIALEMDGNRSQVAHVYNGKLGSSYSAVLRSVFGIRSEFDVDTEQRLEALGEAKRRAQRGEAEAMGEFERLGAELEARGEELTQIVAVERAQLRRKTAS